MFSEASTVQFPLIKHAESIGWTVITQEDALHWRGGEAGLFFYEILRKKLIQLNPGLINEENVTKVIQTMESVPANIEGNRELWEWLRGNRSIYDEVEDRRRHVSVIDFKDIDKNEFHVSYEWAWRSPSRKGNRADVIFLINGIPVAIIENKNPKHGDAMDRAIKQLRRYALETPELIASAQVFNITHLIDYFYGVTWSFDRKAVFNWKTARSESYKGAVQSFFDKSQFLKMLQNWILFYIKDDELHKTVLRQHQTRAVEKVVNRCADSQKTRGLVWHTQGSGKTFTMITAARLILEESERFPGATVLLIVDRNELEGQLSGWLERLAGEHHERKIAMEIAETSKDLQKLLDADYRGLIVSMIHKFRNIRKDSCTRKDFFVLLDEAHRSTGGDLGNYLMAALPKATFIGFTGTPVDKTAYGQGTFKVFGKEDKQGFLDKYSIQESIQDETTLKLRHQLAGSSVRVPEAILDEEFLKLTEAEGVSDIEDLDRILKKAVRTRAFLKAKDRLEKVAVEIAKHFKEKVLPLGYKAFVVAVDREACALYKEELDKHLPKDWTVPIYTKSSNDPIDLPLVAKMQVNEADEKKFRKLFLKPEQNPKIFIVTDKLLTGFDAPILYCMYLDKPMRDHVLLQAMARVNRPYEDETGKKKPCGLVVDFVGVLKEIKKALSFDSDEVNGVIEDIELLYKRFEDLMRSSGAEYLKLIGIKKGYSDDEHLEKIVFGYFAEKSKREQFVDFFKEIESLYEILSPDPKLADYIQPYRRLVDLYLVLKTAYGPRSGFFDEIAKKTENLIRDSAESTDWTTLRKPVEFDAKLLKELKERDDKQDSHKIINLIHTFIRSLDTKEKQYWISISERAEAIADLLEERKVSTIEALTQLEKLSQEKSSSDNARQNSPFQGVGFDIYWVLNLYDQKHAESATHEILNSAKKYSAFHNNSDDMRQLKAEIYRSLLRFSQGAKMLELGDQVIEILRKNSNEL